MQNKTWVNCIDRHVAAGRGDQPALIWDSPMAYRVERITYSEMLERTAKLAGALAALGVNKGDRVIVYMPMVPPRLKIRPFYRPSRRHCISNSFFTL
jgi:propionyl-CoA synthetase